MEEYYPAKILEKLEIQQYLKDDTMTLHQIYQKTVFSFFSHLIYHVILRKLKDSSAISRINNILLYLNLPLINFKCPLFFFFFHKLISGYEKRYPSRLYSEILSFPIVEKLKANDHLYQSSYGSIELAKPQRQLEINRAKR